ncbi:MAG: hypothetical protein QT11_C0001G0766 [archaeon GW2011_AR20]|nr:MAG: hypothetical protein QT11_C0001G0766 [archaeon GW2011_AR20]
MAGNDGKTEKFIYYQDYDNYYQNGDKMSLLNIIDKNTNLRRIFGKKELVIIKKQLLGVPLKESERTRLSRDIRKKLEAIKELSKFSLEFDLKKGAEIKKILEEAKEVIFQNRLFSRVKKIILFGSAAENKLNLNSDIDVAVEFNKISEEEATNFRKEVMGKINEKTDIQVYNILQGKIKREISNKGKVLYEQAH